MRRADDRGAGGKPYPQRFKVCRLERGERFGGQGSGVGGPPLLQRLLNTQSSVGLPPAYLPKEEDDGDVT